MSVTCYPVGDARIAVRANSIWGFHIELPVQCVRDDHGWLPAIGNRPTLVANLRLDARHTDQTHNAIWAARLTLIQ